MLHLWKERALCQAISQQCKQDQLNKQVALIGLDSDDDIELSFEEEE